MDSELSEYNTSQREAIRQKLDTKVKEAFDNSKGRDGSRRIQKELAENGDNRNVKCQYEVLGFNSESGTQV